MTKQLLAFALAAMMAPAHAAAQSLADVAKKAEEERAKAAAAEKDKKEPTKVITNQDLKKDPNAPEAKSTATGEKPKAESARPAEKKTPEKTDPRQTEAYWKRRANELHARLLSDEKAADAERPKVEQMQHAVDAQLDCFGCKGNMRNQLESQLLRLKEQQAKLDAKVAADKKAIADFEDEGRRASILPGWLRPE